MSDKIIVIRKKKKQKAFSLPVDLLRGFEKFAEEHNIDQSETVANLLSDFLKQNAKKMA